MKSGEDLLLVIASCMLPVLFVLLFFSNRAFRVIQILITAVYCSVFGVWWYYTKSENELAIIIYWCAIAIAHLFIVLVVRVATRKEKKDSSPFATEELDLDDQ